MTFEEVLDQAIALGPSHCLPNWVRNASAF